MTGTATRRELLAFLAGSPLLLSARRSDALDWLLAAVAGDAEPIREAAHAVNVFDFEPVARRNLSEAHYTFLSMGVEHEVTLRRNREAFELFQLRPQRLVDVRDTKMDTELLGHPLSCPILLCPCGAQQAFHPEGELAVARAARAADHVQILSTGSSFSLDEVNEARGEPVWYQLYTARVWEGTKRQIAHAEDAGCPVLVLTVDQMGLGQNRDRIQRFRRLDDAECQGCHAAIDRLDRVGHALQRAGQAVGLDPWEWFWDLMILDWDYLDRIRDATSMKLVVKGILTPEDAALCVEHGVDGIVVSNHGGRAEDSGLSTIEVLPEIAEAVTGRVPLLVDSGFRRGTDVYKALALGASAACVGRPYLWGLAAFGEEGARAVLEILRAELEEIMKEMGTPSVAAITGERVQKRQP